MLTKQFFNMEKLIQSGVYTINDGTNNVVIGKDIEGNDAIAAVVSDESDRIIRSVNFLRSSNCDIIVSSKDQAITSNSYAIDEEYDTGDATVTDVNVTTSFQDGIFTIQGTCTITNEHVVPVEYKSAGLIGSTVYWGEGYQTTSEWLVCLGNFTTPITLEPNESAQIIIREVISLNG